MPTADGAKNWLDLIIGYGDQVIFFVLGAIVMYYLIQKGYVVVPSIVKQMSERDKKIERLEARLESMEKRFQDLEQFENLKDKVFEKNSKKLLSDTGEFEALK